MAQKILNFLDTQLDVPQRLRDAIVRMHSGNRPMWRVLSLTRGVSQIVEVAVNLAIDGDTARRIYVVRWYWNDRSIGLTWCDFATLREAQAYQERTFSIDRTHVEVRA